MLWGREIWEYFFWSWSFFDCLQYWNCYWLHPQIWCGFRRIVGIVVFMWCGSVRLHPRNSPMFTLGWFYVLGSSFSSCLVWFYSLCFFWPHLDSLKGFQLGQAVCVWIGWTVVNVFVLSLDKCFSPSDMETSHTASFPSFQKKHWAAATRLHVSRHQFLRSAFPVQVFQKLSYISNWLCDGVCCWHEGHFGWLW